MEQRMSQGMNVDYYEQFFDQTVCPKCKGSRLSANSAAVTVGGINIHEFCCMSVENALDFVNNLELTETEKTISKDIPCSAQKWRWKRQTFAF
jgi:excinuclease ABC subunit A